jgi:hypothetical protein
VDQWTFVGDVHGTGVTGVTCEQDILDPSGTQKQTDSSQITDLTGWTVTAITFAPTAPQGNWTARSRVDVNSSGSNGNFGDTNSTPFGQLDKVVGFVSAYTADKTWCIQRPDPFPVGVSNPIRVSFRQNDGSTNGTAVTLDSVPNIRIYLINSDGTTTDQVAATAMTSLGNGVYGFNWAPTLQGNFMCQILGVYNQSNVTGSVPIIVQSPPLDAIQFALSGNIGFT